MAVPSLDWCTVPRHGRHHLAAPQPVRAVVLIVQDQIEQVPFRPGHGFDEPSRETVGIHGNPQGRGLSFGLEAWQASLQGAFQQSNLLDVLAQALADVGCRAGLTPDHEYDSKPLLKEFDPLRYGGRLTLSCWAARSKLPVRITAASAESWA